MSEQGVLQIAQKLVKRLPKDAGDELNKLILRAKGGQDPIAEIEIIDLLAANENIRRWLREQDNLQDGQKNTTRGYVPLAGDPSAPFSKKWICTIANCPESLPVIQEGEDSPICEAHKIEMVRENKEKG